MPLCPPEAPKTSAQTNLPSQPVETPLAPGGSLQMATSLGDPPDCPKQGSSGLHTPLVLRMRKELMTNPFPLLFVSLS